jgi:hypothetical protein
MSRSREALALALLAAGNGPVDVACALQMDWRIVARLARDRAEDPSAGPARPPEPAASPPAILPGKLAEVGGDPAASADFSEECESVLLAAARAAGLRLRVRTTDGAILLADQPIGVAQLRARLERSR